MGGNIEEFTLDWFANYKNPCDDCANLTPAAARTSRAGSFSHNPQFLRGAYRNGSISLTGRSGDEGVRCARPP
jgi:formylglycine-generating enzyme required for sulfatase activity